MMPEEGDPVPRILRFARPATRCERKDCIAVAPRMRWADCPRKPVVGHQRDAIDFGLGQPRVRRYHGDGGVLSRSRDSCAQQAALAPRAAARPIAVLGNAFSVCCQPAAADKRNLGTAFGAYRGRDAPSRLW